MIKLKGLLTEIAQGDCYEAAGNLILPMFSEHEIPKGAEMVHGMVDGQGALQGKRYGHAWVETDDTVYDYSNGRKLKIPKAMYYGLGNIRKEDNKYFQYHIKNVNKASVNLTCMYKKQFFAKSCSVPST